MSCFVTNVVSNKFVSSIVFLSISLTYIHNSLYKQYKFHIKYKFKY